jgi:hypothetical protein
MRYEYIIEQSTNNVEWTQKAGAYSSLATAKSMSNFRLHNRPHVTVRISRRLKHTYNWTTLFYASKHDDCITRNWVLTGRQETRDAQGKIVRK